MSLRTICFVVLLLPVCAFLQGCPVFRSYGHPDVAPPHLEQTDEDPNTFRMSVASAFRNQEDWIKAIRVIDCKEANKGNLVVCWEIRAKERVSMHGFQVEVGCVPEGFEQIVPEEGAKFIPEIGKLYYMAVLLENLPRWGWLQSMFEAGRHNPGYEDWRVLLKNRSNNGKD